MKKVTAQTVTKYEMGNGFFYLVEEDESGFSAWFGVSAFGYMSFSIGCAKTCTPTLEDFLSTLEGCFETDKKFFAVDFGKKIASLKSNGFWANGWECLLPD